MQCGMNLPNALTIARIVLALCSAQPADGGLGAVYVLLRK